MPDETPTTSADNADATDVSEESSVPTEAETGRPSFEHYFQALGEEMQSANDLVGTKDRIDENLPRERPNTPPEVVNAWECRIGGCKFYVPPLSISVDQVYKAGSVSGAALRQDKSPKFNTGHRETMITMRLYFPNYKSVFGYEAAADQAKNFVYSNNDIEDAIFDIDFDNDDDGKIDEFLSSLRGLIAQFKFAPFLPIRNTYLNQVFDVSGVVLKDISISSSSDFPFALMVDLVMYKFNHKIYLPMINDFSQAVHWGRYRQYMGRAAVRLAQSSRPIASFREAAEIAASYEPPPVDNDDITGDTEIEGFIGVSPSIQSNADIIHESQSFNPSIPSSYSFKRYSFGEANAVRFFYPYHVPDGIELPDLDDLKPYPEATPFQRGAWEELLHNLGFDVLPSQALWDEVNAGNSNGYIEDNDEFRLLLSVFRRLGAVGTAFSPQAMENHIQERINELNIADEAQESFRAQITDIWFYAIYRFILEDPVVADRLALNARIRNQIFIEEWELPMIALSLDPNKVKVQSVQASLGNRVAKQQLQLQDEPSYQHIGGEDSRCAISMRVFGESELIKIRRMFDTISGIARLESNHGVLGFLGIQSIVTELIGMRYIIPLDYRVDTIPNYPHVYDVTLMFTDFDIFQQKRETLNHAQQAELAVAFSKANPFLRLKQLWGFVNNYPDFPLSVRDGENNIVGHLDPDFYFRHFKTIDADITAPPGTEESNEFIEVANPEFHMGNIDGIDTSMIATGSGVILQDNGQPVGALRFNEQTAASQVEGTVTESASPAIASMAPTYENNDPASNWHAMMQDARYRENDGRMLRAFPTYMLWMINERGLSAGIDLFDDFYGLQSVIDMSIVRSEDILADTLVLRVSNLYSRLSAPFLDYIENTSPSAVILNSAVALATNRAVGDGSTYGLRLDSIELKPGARVHLRLGYGADPNQLDTVFNGVVTEVEQGEILTITCQSDAVELSAYVETTDSKGHSGQIDGSLGGLYLSEPRDLMLNLLSAGSNAFREAVAQATRGAIFSENKYGIRHFGAMIYSPLNAQEVIAYEDRAKHLREKVEEFNEEYEENEDASLFQSSAARAFLDQMFVNLTLKRDYEIFKRNIYPGNGLGVAQYLGGDLGEAGLQLAIDNAGVFSGTVQNVEGELHGNQIIAQQIENIGNEVVEEQDSQASRIPTVEQNNRQSNATSAAVAGAGLLSFMNPAIGVGTSVLAGGIKFSFSSSNKAIRQALNLTTATDEGDGSFDEVAFRASTYMATVWDLFKLSAAMLPDYIVAVRPFEHRSTVFYGKPHWLYTSGVIPLTTGVDPQGAPSLINYSSEEMSINRVIDEFMHAEGLEDKDGFGEFFADIENYTPSSNPNLSSGVSSASISEIRNMPTSLNGVELPWSEGRAGLEMHLPTVEEMQDINEHTQLQSLPARYQHPFYMDRLGGGQGGYTGTYQPGQADTVLGENAALPGQPGALGRLRKDEEQWYMNMRWTSASGATSGWRDPWAKARVLVYCEETQRAVVCCVGEYGPAQAVVDAGKVAGISPDTYWYLTNGESIGGGSPRCIYRVFPDQSAPYGPVNLSGSSSSLEVFDLPNQGTSASNSGPLPVGADATGGSSDNSDGGEIAPSNYDLDRDEDLLSDVASDIAAENAEIDAAISEADREIIRSVYSGQFGSRSDEDYEKIWQEFEEFFGLEPKTKATFLEHPDISLLPEEVIAEVFFGVTEVGQEPAPDSEYYKAVESFVKTLRENPYANGWVARVAHRRIGSDLYSGILRSAGAASVDTPFGIIGDTIASTVVNTAGLVAGAVDDTITLIGQLITGDTETLFENRDWDFGEVYNAWAVYIAQGERPALSYIRAHTNEGNDSASLFFRGVEKTAGFFAGMDDLVDRVTAATGGIFSGLISFFKMNLDSLSAGITRQSTVQRRTNTLNRMLNDSLYFNAGIDHDTGEIVNPILFYADNPFTREFGEPVVEIRQPFQRVHTIGSFQNILSNQVVETTEDVYTVVNAVSNDSHPVKVHFDKSSSPEKQKEKTIETGLIVDKPSGFFDTVKFVFNPARALRYFSTNLGAKGGAVGQDVLAKRVALWHLKESLKDIYQGEIICVGDASIRPHDLVYMADVYTRMYGTFEVEQVVHHFTPETGFITSITPNALVSINDPARFSFTAWADSRWSLRNFRNETRRRLQVQAGANLSDSAYENSDISELFEPYEITVGGQSVIIDSNREATIEELVNAQNDSLDGTLQFMGGNTNAIKTMAGAVGMGGAVGGTSGSLAASATGGLAGGVATSTVGAPLAAAGALVGWKAWTWVRDNLLDQHGATILYLRKNGQPMDAGLNDNQGVAVGQTNSTSLAIAGLRIYTINQETPSGETTLKYSDVTKSIAWEETGPNEAAQQVDLFVDSTIATVRNLQRESLVTNGVTARAYWVRIDRVIDGDTFVVTVLGMLNLGIGDFTIDVDERPRVGDSSTLVATDTPSSFRVRLQGVDAPEDPFKDDEGNELNDTLQNVNYFDQGRRASEYAKDRLEGRLVALRVNPDDRYDQFGRTLGYVFHNTPEDFDGLPDSNTDRRNWLLQVAAGSPAVPWNSFLSNGRPVTFNWELLINGLADAYTADLTQTVPDDESVVGEG